MKNSAITVLICLVAGIAGAQDTTWHSMDGILLPDKVGADYYMVKTKDPDDWGITLLEGWYISGEKYAESSFTDYGTPNRSGAYKEWHRNGNKQAQITYKDSQFDGVLESWWDNGQQRRRDLYDKGLFVEGQCYDEAGNPVEHYLFQVMAEYPGGEQELMRFLQTNITYPKFARRKGIMGIVVVSFVVDQNGMIGNIKVLQSVHPLLDEEAVRVIKSMPRWIPGSLEGKAVCIQYNQPLQFSLK